MGHSAEVVADDGEAGLHFQLKAVGWILCEQQLVADGFEQGEGVSVIGDANVMCGGVFGVGSDQAEAIEGERDGAITECVGQAGDAMVEGIDGAGDGEAYFEG